MSDCAACGRPMPDTAFVCARCERDLAVQLRGDDRHLGSADLWPELLTTAAGQARMAEPGPRSRRLAPAEPIRPGLEDPATDQQGGWPAGLPFSFGASVVREDVEVEVVGYARLVAEERYPWPPPVGPRCGECEHPTCERLWRYEQDMLPPATMPDLMRWLAGQLGWCRYRPWAGEMWDHLGEQLRRIAPAVDRPVQRVDMGPCDTPTSAGPCRHRLSARPGADGVRCGGCGTRHSVEDRRQELLAAARDRRGSATEVARWLDWLGVDCTPSIVRGLAHRGRILADRHGRYRLGDVEELRVEASRERMSA